MGTFRHPVGPLPGSVYWRRRAVLLGIPLFLIGLVAYACTGTTGTPTNNAGANGGQGGPGSGASPTGVISAAPSETASGPPGVRYPGGGPTGSGSTGGSGGASGSPGGASGGASSGTGSNGSSTAQAGLGGGSGCALSLSLALDRTSSSGPVQYPAGSYPTFKITAADAGSVNCTVDVSGRGLVVSVMPLGTTTPVWTSATCSGAADLRALGPGDNQTYPVLWKRWEGQGDTCPVSKLPTVSPGTYTVNAEADGVTTSQIEFILN